MLSSTRSSDLRLGVKVQSNWAIADSSRDIPQDDLAGDGYPGRALIGKPREEILTFLVKLQTGYHRRRLESGHGGKLRVRKGNNPTLG